MALANSRPNALDDVVEVHGSVASCQLLVVSCQFPAPRSLYYFICVYLRSSADTMIAVINRATFGIAHAAQASIDVDFAILHLFADGSAGVS